MSPSTREPTPALSTSSSLAGSTENKQTWAPIVVPGPSPVGAPSNQEYDEYEGIRLRMVQAIDLAQLAAEGFPSVMWFQFGSYAVDDAEVLVMITRVAERILPGLEKYLRGPKVGSPPPFLYSVFARLSHHIDDSAIMTYKYDLVLTRSTLIALLANLAAAADTGNLPQPHVARRDEAYRHLAWHTDAKYEERALVDLYGDLGILVMLNPAASLAALAALEEMVALADSGHGGGLIACLIALSQRIRHHLTDIIRGTEIDHIAHYNNLGPPFDPIAKIE